MSVSASEFNAVLGWGIAVLALKTILCNFLTVRARFGSQTFATKEDAHIPGGILFKFALLAFGPLTSQDTVTRLSGIVRNSLENEPFFFFTAFAYNALNAAPADCTCGVLLVKLYVVTRILHALTYLFAVQPFRAVFWLSGVAVMAYMAFRIVVTTSAQANILEFHNEVIKAVRDEF